MALNSQHILIVGAGIAGLAAARALALRGATVTVLEQAPAITEVGAGLQVSPNGMAVLKSLGLAQALLDTGAPRARALLLHDHAGRRLGRFPQTRLARGDDYLLVHRADLIEVLAQGARDAGVDIQLGQTVQQVTPGAAPTVTLTDGTSRQADLIIGADGLHSPTARAVVTRDQPFFTGQIAWRAVIPGDNSPHEVELYMAPGRHLVTYPLRGGTLRNIVAVEERQSWAEESWSTSDDPRNVQQAFAGMGARPRALLDQIDKVNIWGLFRHPVADRWHAPGVALLGDAVHPTLPFLAQGACMGLEDAWVLADQLDRHQDQGQALAAYQSLRHARVTRVVDAASRNARHFHLSGVMAFGAGMGIRMLGLVMPGYAARSFAWVYEHDVTGGVSLI
ncbi:FAD-dependent oxidoreductase [Pseudooceanicola sp. MF1-13]|uniref:FAD-dependent oxidoreductase n=1 Tax=Pseudooceanicola sp. MF1-13 TaxID=3379095 RepID=UPI0038920A45